MPIHPQWLNLTQLFARSNYRERDKGPWTLGSQWLDIAAGGAKQPPNSALGSTRPTAVTLERRSPFTMLLTEIAGVG